MTDHEKATTITLPDAPTAPAVHGTAVWQGIEDLAVALPTGTPMPDTKQAYWDTLNRLGFRMKDQQESTTGPERPFIPWNDPAPIIPDRRTPPFTRGDAEAICAASAVWYRHGVIQTFWCPTCFAIGRPSGTEAHVRSRTVLIRCRCGAQEYVPPVGTTDLPTRIANTATTATDHGIGVLGVSDELRAIPTTRLQRDEVRAIRAYIDVLERYGLQARLFCTTCWTQTSHEEEFAMRVSVQPDAIALACTCRMLYGG